MAKDVERRPKNQGKEVLFSFILLYYFGATTVLRARCTTKVETKSGYYAPPGAIVLRSFIVFIAVALYL